MITLPIENKTIEEAIRREIAVKAVCIGKKYPLLKKLKSDQLNANFKDFWSLKNISFEADKGEIIGIIGRNGSGKTTLLNILAGVLSPTLGEVLTKGRVFGLFSLGTGFQDELSGKENIYLNGALLGAGKKELDSKLASIIEFSELGNFINMPLGSYSMGMRLRLAFSIIANLDFDILVTDEIFAVGDGPFQNKCFQRMMDFKRAGKTMILATQDVSLVERLCGRSLVLDHGELLYYGNAEEAVNNYRAVINSEKFFVGPENNNYIVNNTKKWADDISAWGQKLGTKEAVIENVYFLNRFGIKCRSVKTGSRLKIKVSFFAKNMIKEPHFGIAVFREDGVYCYGPNSNFDNHYIPHINKGRGYFVLNFDKIPLMPGDYRISAAIWDKNETLAFDYHEGCYKLRITGRDNEVKELIRMSYKIKNVNNYPLPEGERVRVRGLDSNETPSSPSSPLWGEDELEKESKKDIRINYLELLDASGHEKNIFMTNELMEVKISLNNTEKIPKIDSLRIDFYRQDGIYCQGITIPVSDMRQTSIFFKKMPLLPGKYRISVSAPQAMVRDFAMVFSKKDHGTVYLQHKWKWKYNT